MCVLWARQHRIVSDNRNSDQARRSMIGLYNLLFWWRGGAFCFECVGFKIMDSSAGSRYKLDMSATSYI